jgi:hypothetical protein
MNPVLEFLQKHPDYSFDEGVAVLLRYSANRGVNTFITVRRDRQHLRNELNRLAHIPNLRPLPGMEEPKPVQDKHEAVIESAKKTLDESRDALKTEEITEESIENIAAHQDTLEEAINGGDINSIKSAEDGLLKAWGNAKRRVQESEKESNHESPNEEDADIVSFLDLKRHETYKPEELPTPMLKELWEKNRDEYKELQHCHTQMKQANSDAGRADWRNKLLALRKSLSERWKLFDEEMERVNAEKAAQADTQQKAYNPLNDRAYISKSLKKEAWDDARKLEVQHRVDALLQHNQTISEETRKALKERGITIDE